MSHRRCGALALSAVALLIVWCSMATAVAAERTKVKVGYYPALVDIPVFIAESQGIFTKNGLDVEMISFTTGPALIGSLLSGSTPFIDGGGALLSFPQVSRGHKIRGVANFWAQNLYTLIVRNDVPTPNMGQPYPAPARDLKGKRIGVVALGSTGATTGIGSACRNQLLESGARVVGMDIRPAAFTPVSTSDDAHYHHVVFDLASVASVRAAVDEAIEWLGGVDVLLHFAAIWTPQRWDDIDESEWSRVCEANLRGTFFLSQAVARRMVTSGAGSIVLTGSDAVNMGRVAGGPAYVTSKGGVIALTRALARALAPHGVRVNAINPGVIDTPMTASWSAEVKQEVVRQTPMGRFGTPEEVAAVALFVASNAAKFVTGEVVEVNGGFYFG